MVISLTKITHILFWPTLRMYWHRLHQICVGTTPSAAIFFVGTTPSAVISFVGTTQSAVTEGIARTAESVYTCSTKPMQALNTRDWPWQQDPCKHSTHVIGPDSKTHASTLHTWLALTARPMQALNTRDWPWQQNPCKHLTHVTGTDSKTSTWAVFGQPPSSTRCCVASRRSYWHALLWSQTHGHLAIIVSSCMCCFKTFLLTCCVVVTGTWPFGYHCVIVHVLPKHGLIAVVGLETWQFDHHFVSACVTSTCYHWNTFVAIGLGSGPGCLLLHLLPFH